MGVKNSRTNSEPKLRSRMVAASLIAVVVALLGIAPAALAGDSNVAIGASVGTLGIGVDLSGRLSQKFNVRGSVKGFSYDTEREEDDIDYDVSGDLFTVSALVDWFVTGGGFRITGGLVYNGNEAAAVAILEEGTVVEIGDEEYPAEAVGDLTGDVTFDPVAPYLGIGYGNPFRGSKSWHFFFDLGVMFHGEGEVKLNASNPLGIPGLEEEVAKEQAKVQDDISDYNLYPVLTAGVSYRF